MLSFKQFIILERVENEKWYQEKQSGGGHFVDHRAEVHGHHVQVMYNSYLGDGHYDVDFLVDGQIDRSATKIASHKSMAILNHIRNSVNTFRLQYQPKRMYFSADDSDSDAQKNKDRVYARFSNRIGNDG